MTDGVKRTSGLFGTDGIRGEAGRYPLDEPTVRAIGRAVGELVGRVRPGPRVVVGRDTRASGSMLQEAFCGGLAVAGARARLTGVLPTPGVAYLTRALSADAGVMISASHNPYRDNGIKVFSSEGFKLSDEEESEVEALIFGGLDSDSQQTAGEAKTITKSEARYVDFLKGALPKGMSLSGLKIVLDTANGATHKVAPEVFSAAGAEVTVIHEQPDGTNINEDCGSEHTGDLRRTVLERGADLGLAFDGDGDRMIAVDERGQELTGDQTIIICADMLKREGRLRNDQIVSTVMSNIGLSVACERLGLKNHAAKVGDRHVVEDMRRLGAVLGGEPSGHVVFLEEHTTGDGVLTGLQLALAMLRADRSLSTLGETMEVFPQSMVSVEVASKPDLALLPSVIEAIQQVESELGTQGRVLVRYSGTQDLCRVMVEGPSVEVTEKYCALLAEVVREAIG